METENVPLWSEKRLETARWRLVTIHADPRDGPHRAGAEPAIREALVQAAAEGLHTVLALDPGGPITAYTVGDAAELVAMLDEAGGPFAYSMERQAMVACDRGGLVAPPVVAHITIDLASAGPDVPGLLPPDGASRSAAVQG
ncbi:hypothetical protein [Sphaerisporangium album]|uniref:hypothetical protein n=1 Tax=Sphaerisporangium album TaxID=509200 RepID=UPI0011C04EF3|nr:hypothetical protein [Sphaerisporangium album]